MNVYPVIPRGYCKGVINAIKIVKDCAEKYKNQPVYILGMIVHNQYIVNALKDLNIITIEEKNKTRLELLDSINQGIVIMSAHGVSKDVFLKAQKKGLIIIDATCVDVIKTHKLIENAILKGKEVLYIGKKGHPESEGTLAIDKNKIHLIEKKEDILQFKETNISYIMTNQTTMSLWDIYQLNEYAKEQIKDIEFTQEICNATKIRQEAIVNLPKEIDLVLIVGDPHSNNSTRLKMIAEEKAFKEAYLIESINDLSLEKLKNKQYIAVSSGASTPTYLTNQVIEYLKQLDFKNEKTLIKPLINYSKILD